MRWMIVMAAALALFGTTAAAQPGKGKDGSKKANNAVIEGDVGRKLDAYLAKLDVEDGGFCGNVLVAVGGKILLEKGHGLADAAAKRAIEVDALWDWASVTKQFTAAAVLRLQDQKKLKLDDPLKKFFPEAPADKAAVTLRQLLNHTSGIQSGFRNEWRFNSSQRESLEKLVLGLPMTAKPGERWEYSNSVYGFVATIIERLSGKSFETFCAEELFKRAGMKDACFIGMPQLDLGRVPKIDRGQGFTERPRDFAFAYGNQLSWGYLGCGGAVATTRDMHLWDRALRGEKLLSKSAREELFQPGLNNYALGWEVRGGTGHRVASHSGGVQGVVTYYLRGLDEDYCVALACSYQPKTHPAAAGAEVLRIVRDGK